MIPTEHEYTVATHAAAEAHYERYRKTHPEVTLPPWAEGPPHLKRAFLENVLPIVDAAISAIPDRLDRVRAMLEFIDVTDMTPAGRRMLEKALEQPI